MVSLVFYFQVFEAVKELVTEQPAIEEIMMDFEESCWKSIPTNDRLYQGVNQCQQMIG